MCLHPNETFLEEKKMNNRPDLAWRLPFSSLNPNLLLGKARQFLTNNKIILYCIIVIIIIVIKHRYVSIKFTLHGSLHEICMALLAVCFGMALPWLL